MFITAQKLFILVDSLVYVKKTMQNALFFLFFFSLFHFIFIRISFIYCNKREALFTALIQMHLCLLFFFLLSFSIFSCGLTHPSERETFILLLLLLLLLSTQHTLCNFRYNGTKEIEEEEKTVFFPVELNHLVCFLYVLSLAEVSFHFLKLTQFVCFVQFDVCVLLREAFLFSLRPLFVMFPCIFLFHNALSFCIELNGRIHYIFSIKCKH